jgi:hypothetical protein
MRYSAEMPVNKEKLERGQRVQKNFQIQRVWMDPPQTQRLDGNEKR